MRRDRVDLNLLIALDALLHERNVTRAAARLRVGQPAMSASLARLRRVFSDPLLARTGRGFALTPLAQSLIQPLEAVLADVENMLTLRPGFDPAADVHSFTVISSDYITFILLRHLIPALNAEAPRIAIRIQPLSEDFQQVIERGEADILIAPAEFDQRLHRLRHHRLFEERYVGVVWAGNPEVGEILTLEEFCRIPQLDSDPTQFGSVHANRLKQLGIHRNVEIVTQSFVMSPLLLRGTRLLAIVHERIALEMALVSGYRILELPLDLGTLAETMYWHPRMDSDPAHRWLRDRVATLATGILPGLPASN
jgi:DNA-binding transcriptional LysR family regulator